MDKKALFSHLASLLLFGMNGIVASRIALNSYEIVFFRTFIGSILLLALFLLTKGRFHIRECKKDALFIALSGIAMGTSWMFLYEAFSQVGVSLATLLYYCGPVIMMVLSPLLFCEKLTAPKLIGFATVLVGLILINGQAVRGGANLWGLFCGLMSAVTYFFMVTFNKQSKKITGMENSVLQLIFAFVTVAIFLGIKQGFTIRVEACDWGWILLLGLLHTGIGCYLYFSSLSKLPAQTVALCGYLEPLSAVLFAALFLREAMSPLQAVGSVCIVGGAMLGELVHGKKHKEVTACKKP